MDQHAYTRAWAAVAVVGLAMGSLAVTCKSGSDEPDPGPEAAQQESSAEQGAAVAAEEATEAESDETASALPGEAEAGARQPESPGPKGAGIFFLAGLKGYLEPCGCTADVMLGGAERLAGYIDAARELYTGALMVDAGDTLFESREIEEHLIPQEKAKADVIVEMHRAFQTRVLVPGERDFALGAEYYLETMSGLDATMLGANLSIAGDSLQASKVRSVGEWKVALVGAVQSELYDGIEGVEATSVEPAVGEALDAVAEEEPDATVLLLHGDLKTAKELLEAHEGLDFVMVGHDPRETDQVDQVGGGHTLEAYDQGRYVGILKLFGPDREAPFENARTGSESELEQVSRQIEHVEESIEKLPPAPPGEGPPILKRLRGRLEKLERRREEIKNADLEVSDTRRSFLYRPVAMRPGYPIDASIRKQRVAYNRKLEELTKQVEREIPEVPEGEATYVGTNQCKGCHQAAHEFWKGTLHADAMETLHEREKAWDEKCVRCHVVGYAEPGGSLVGKLRYEAEVGGSTIEKNLRDVGCEACHGPGSRHRAAPVGGDGEPQHIEAGSGAEVCTQCHVPEHSPRFNYDTYVREITGEGHALGESEQ